MLPVPPPPARAAVDWPEPLDSPRRYRWWSIQSPLPAGPISAPRGYAEVLLVYAAFFAVSILVGAESLAHRYPPPSGSWAIYVPAALSQIAIAGLAVTVAVLLSARRGITPRMLGLGLPVKSSGGVAIAQTFRIAVWAVAALLAGGLVTTALATGHLNQPVHQGASYLLYATAASLHAGIVEETIALAFTVSTLRQAGRPVPEIVLVAVLLRCSYHDYYGPGVIGIAIWAAVFVWLYLRLGSIIPLVIVHILWDVTIFFGQQPALRHAFNVGRSAVILLLPLIATITWLAEVARRSKPDTPEQGWVS